MDPPPYYQAMFPPPFTTHQSTAPAPATRAPRNPPSGITTGLRGSADQLSFTEQLERDLLDDSPPVVPGSPLQYERQLDYGSPTPHRDEALDESQHPTFAARPYRTLGQNDSFHGVSDLSFLIDAQPGCGRMIVANAAGERSAIHGLDVEKIGDACPKLASKFTEITRPSNGAVLQEEDLNTYDMTQPPQGAVIALLRWIYLEDYTFCQAMIDRPVPLLFHLQVLKLARKLELPGLDILAQMHIEANTSAAEQINEPIVDICSAIRYIYTDLRECEGLRRIVATFCLSTLRAKTVGDEETFAQTVCQSPLFHRDLVRANFETDFGSPLAEKVINMKVCDNRLHGQPPYEAVANDFLCEFHTDFSSSESRVKAGAEATISASPVTEKTSSPKRRAFSFEDDADDEDVSLESSSKKARCRLSTSRQPTKGWIESYLPCRSRLDKIEAGASTTVSDHTYPRLSDHDDQAAPGLPKDPGNEEQEASGVSTDLPEHPKARFLQEMARNSRIAEASKNVAKTNSADRTSQSFGMNETSATKSRLVDLLRGESAYGRGSLERERAATEKKAVKRDAILDRQSIGSERFEVVDLSEEEEWEMVEDPASTLGEGT